jgi:hypothetical protein
VQQQPRLRSGYIHRAYADSLAEFGTPRHLPGCDGWTLERPVGGGEARDAMGCYPIFACRDWSKLGSDLEAIGEDLVSMVFVADPFGNHAPAELETLFPDRMVAFKEHFVVDLAADPLAGIAKNHRRNAQSALAKVSVDICADPAEFAGEWTRLYGNLVERHGLRGITAFSERSLALQLGVPGMTVFRASIEGEAVGAILWYTQGDAAYYHLGAYSDQGYAAGASFALFTRAIEHFTHAGLRWLNLGAGAGAFGDGRDGLTRFKKGWATGTRTAYLCGRIFDRDRYDALTRAAGREGTGYFPAYRAGEFA